MSSRRDSPPLPEDNGASARSPSLTRSRASSGSLASVSSITSLNGLLSSPSTATAATSAAAGSSSAVLANGHVPASPNSYTALNGGAPSSTYYPAFPIRNKSRTPSVSSTSTITQPVHSLLQTSSGILPKRHAAPVSAAPTLSTASATASLSLASPALSTTSSPTGSVKYTMASATLSNSSSATSIDTSTANGRSTASNPTLVLEPINTSFAAKSLELPENARVKIGRQTGVTTAPSSTNGYFDSKVLSRVHAEVWSENGRVFIKDLKSSNGTFLNGKRLSPENVESEPFDLNQNDHLEFGIDIMDDSGSMLHEKVACKVYFFTMSYPTPGGSPQEAHARLKSSSPTESGSNSLKSRPASVSGGQGTNIDLIISRLQSELTRSQETNADLGALKQGLGELERTITVSAKEEGKLGGSKGSQALTQATQAVEYQRQLVENNQAYATEIARLTRMLEDTQAEMNAYVQKIQLLEPLVEDDEILRRDIAQNSAELTRVKLDRDLAKDSMNELITEHQQAMQSLRKEQETAMAVLEAAHKETLERVARETAMAQELLTLKHQENLEKAIQSIATPEVDSANAEEVASLQLEVSSLTTKVGILQQTVKKQFEEIREMNSEKNILTRELSETKAVVVNAEMELKEARDRTTQENVAVLTPTSPEINAEGTICKECRGRATTTATVTSVTSSTRDSKDVVARYEFSWIQFVFPMGKKSQSLPFNQPSTALMSGGFMLMGIGAYVFWHKGVRP